MIALKKNNKQFDSVIMVVFFLSLLSRTHYSWSMQVVQALVITMEPLVAQIKKREYNQAPFQEIDKFVISHALQHNTNLSYHIKKHGFVRDDLSVGRRIYRGTKICPYVIEANIPLNDPSLLAQYIAHAIQTNNFRLLQTSYTTCEVGLSSIIIRSQFDNKKKLLQYIEDLQRSYSQ